MWRSVCSFIMCFSYRYRAHTRRASNRYCFHSVSPCSSDEQKHRSDSSILTMMLLIWLHNGNKLCRKIYALIPFLVFFFIHFNFPFVFAPYSRNGAHLIGKCLHFRFDSVDWPTERSSTAVRQIVHADGFACELQTTCFAWKRKHVSFAVWRIESMNRRSTENKNNWKRNNNKKTWNISNERNIVRNSNGSRWYHFEEKVIVWRSSRVYPFRMFWKPINRR